MNILKLFGTRQEGVNLAMRDLARENGHQVVDFTRAAVARAKHEDSFLGRLFRRNPKRAGGIGELIAGIMATTYNYTGGVVGGSGTGGMVAAAGQVAVENINLNFATIATARTAAGSSALAAADVMQLIGVLAKTWVVATFIRVVTAEGATCTVDLGDGADTDGYQNDSDINGAVASLTSSLITTAYSLAVAGGKVYTADDTIDLIPNNNATDVAVIEVFALCVDLRSYRS